MKAWFARRWPIVVLGLVAAPFVAWALAFVGYALLLVVGAAWQMVLLAWAFVVHVVAGR